MRAINVKDAIALMLTGVSVFNSEKEPIYVDSGFMVIDDWEEEVDLSEYMRRHEKSVFYTDDEKEAKGHCK